MMVLRGVLSDSQRNIFVWCPFCDAIHKHAWDADIPDWGIVARVSHCENASPLKETGYYVGRFPAKKIPVAARL